MSVLKSHYDLELQAGNTEAVVVVPVIRVVVVPVGDLAVRRIVVPAAAPLPTVEVGRTTFHPFLYFHPTCQCQRHITYVLSP